MVEVQALKTRTWGTGIVLAGGLDARVETCEPRIDLRINRMKGGPCRCAAGLEWGGEVVVISDLRV